MDQQFKDPQVENMISDVYDQAEMFPKLFGMPKHEIKENKQNSKA